MRIMIFPKVVILFLAMGSEARGNTQVRRCNVEDMPVVLLRKEGGGQFSLEERYEPNVNISSLEHAHNVTDPQVRRLRSINSSNSPTDGYEMRGLVLSRNESSSLNGNLTNFNISQESESYFYARECNCFNDSSAPLAFCPMTVDTCRVNDTSPIPICRKDSRGNSSFVNTMYYYLPVWMLILVFLCFLRKGVGANGRDFLLSLCIPKYREWLADRILRSNPERAQELFRSHYIHQEVEIDRRRRWIASVIDDPEVLRQHDEMQRGQLDVVAPQPIRIDFHIPRQQSTSLVLKTTVYHSHDNGESHVEEEEEGETCSICVTAFADGDRIGNLEVCDHKFHVDCLKQWLRRKNTCPLCQKHGIAKPQRTSLQQTSPQRTSSDVTSLQST